MNPISPGPPISVPRFFALSVLGLFTTLAAPPEAMPAPAKNPDNSGARFFENRIRPLLAEHCYKCHSEEAGEQKGGLLLDRESGWLKGGDTENAVVAGEPESSLLIKAIRYNNEDLQMPPKYKLKPEEIRLLESWVNRGAPAPADDMGDTEFSMLGNQDHLFANAATHWAFRPLNRSEPPGVQDAGWNHRAIDRFVFSRLDTKNLKPSRPANPRDLLRRLSYDLTGLPPTFEQVTEFTAAIQKHRPNATRAAIDTLLASPAFGEHFARLWLDVARYADTDSSYRPDTKTPRYFPFAFTYRDYVINAFNADKPYDQFIREQLAADLLGLDKNAPELAALGFLAVGPHLKRADDAIDDWIDLTTRGLMGVTVACARCHDHKYEPVPTADYYALHGVFASIKRSDPLDEKRTPLLPTYKPTPDQLADYEKKRAKVDKSIEDAGAKKARGNNRSVAEKIRETDLAKLLIFHEGGPARTMVVAELKRPVEPYVFLRGQRGARGDTVPRRFLKILDAEQKPFPSDSSGRLELVEKIVDPQNPLTARVFVNRVWGRLMGGHIVDTTSDFGLQGSPPSHPQLLDWLAADFIDNDWSIKHLVRRIVSTRAYQQRSEIRKDAEAIDPINRLYWRANRKHLNIEAIRDSLLATSGELDARLLGRAAQLWGDDYTRRRAIYGYIDRFNLDPTLRTFDFPAPMQTQPARDESIVAPQALFTMNAPFVIDQAVAVTKASQFNDCASDEKRTVALFELILQRRPNLAETTRTTKFVQLQKRFFKDPKKKGIDSPWPIAAQALYMSNEFQYID
jgi:mono/diheme cytochrome c family protein